MSDGYRLTEGAWAPDPLMAPRCPPEVMAEAMAIVLKRMVGTGPTYEQFSEILETAQRRGEGVEDTYLVLGEIMRLRRMVVTVLVNLERSLEK